MTLPDPSSKTEVSTALQALTVLPKRVRRELAEAAFENDNLALQTPYLDIHSYMHHMHRSTPILNSCLSWFGRYR